MKRVVRKDPQATKTDGAACIRMALSLFAALLLAMCMASPAPSAAMAAEDAWEAEPMETDDAESSTSMDEVSAQSESESEATNDQTPLLANGEDEPSAVEGEESSSATQMVFQDGMAQPVFKYSNARDEGYTNQNSELWRFCVYVESDYDTDLDGKCDLIKVYVQVPRAAVLSGKDGWKAPVLYEARPYNGGMATDLHGLIGFATPELSEEGSDASMDLRQDYTITIQNDKSSASIPTTADAADPEPGPSPVASSNNTEDEDALDDSDSSSDPAPTSTNTTTSTSPLPHTGDDSPVAMPIALALVAAVALVQAKGILPIA